MSYSPEHELPIVPDQLVQLLSDHNVADTIDKWQHSSLSRLLNNMPDPELVDAGGHKVGVVTLEPTQGDVDETNTIVMTLPHQQAWKPSMFMRAEFMRQVVAPKSRAIIFPNNSWQMLPYYNFSREDCAKMQSGDTGPMSERQARVLENLRISSVSLTGYSLGGWAALGLASVGSSNFDITHVNSDEMPSGMRTTKQLRKDFLASGTWSDQQAALGDSRIPALEAALSAPKLATDYAHFGISTLLRENRSLLGLMSGNATGLVEAALLNHPGIRIKIGRVAGSLLMQKDGMRYPPSVRDVEYTGIGTHMHSTGDNVVAHALMAKDGLGNGKI